MRWSKAFSKTGLLALMLAVVGIGIFFMNVNIAAPNSLRVTSRSSCGR